MSDLRECHQNSILEYLQFASTKRRQQLKEVDNYFADEKDMVLDDEHYQADDVRGILDNLSTVVRAAVDTELMTMSHMTVLCLRQVFEQAEAHDLNLKTDASCFENEKLLEETRRFEERFVTLKEANKANQASLLSMKGLGMKGTNIDVVKENNELREECEKLRQRVKHLEEQARMALKEKSGLANDLSQMNQNMDLMSIKMEKEKAFLDAKASKNEKQKLTLEQQIESLRTQLDHANEKLRLTSDMGTDKATTLKTVKKLMESKNREIESLRVRLAKHENVFDDINAGDD
eukprot:Rmarinus@m.23741